MEICRYLFENELAFERLSLQMFSKIWYFLCFVSACNVNDLTYPVRRIFGYVSRKELIPNLLRLSQLSLRRFVRRKRPPATIIFSLVITDLMQKLMKRYSIYLFSYVLCIGLLILFVFLYILLKSLILGMCSLFPNYQTFEAIFFIILISYIILISAENIHIQVF